MMARRSKVENNTPHAVAEGSPAKDAPSSPVRRPGSKTAAVARWLRRILSTVLVLVVLAAVGVGSIALNRGTWQVNSVLSGSMRPGFAVGGVVISERIPVDQLALRDVMVFASPDNPATLIVHRIVAMSKDKSGQLVIKTQGDANDARDPWTLTIRGKYAYLVRWSVPLLGYAAVAYQNHRGLVLLAAGIVLLAAAISAILKQRRNGEASEEVDESESNSSLDTAVTSPASAVEDATVASSIEGSDVDPMASSTENPGDSEALLDAPSLQKPQRRRRFGRKKD